MTTKQKHKQAPGSIDPDRLYAFEELADLTGLSDRRLRRMADDGRIGYVLVGEERGRVIRGRQYLDWLDARSIAPQVA